MASSLMTAAVTMESAYRGTGLDGKLGAVVKLILDERKPSISLDSCNLCKSSRWTETKKAPQDHICLPDPTKPKNLVYYNRLNRQPLPTGTTVFDLGIEVIRRIIVALTNPKDTLVARFLQSVPEGQKEEKLHEIATKLLGWVYTP